MKKKTITLQGVALNYAVAVARELQICIMGLKDKEIFVQVAEVESTDQGNAVFGEGVLYTPSTGSQGDDIIDEFGIATRRHSSGKWYAILSVDLGDSTSPSWSETTYKGGKRYGTLSYEVTPRIQTASGDTRREAAMRCFVLSLLGDEVSIPKSLC
jgi:hypothetical protein